MGLAPWALAPGSAPGWRSSPACPSTLLCALCLPGEWTPEGELTKAEVNRYRVFIPLPIMFREWPVGLAEVCICMCLFWLWPAGV